MFVDFQANFVFKAINQFVNMFMCMFEDGISLRVNNYYLI